MTDFPRCVSPPLNLTPLDANRSDPAGFESFQAAVPQEEICCASDGFENVESIEARIPSPAHAAARASHPNGLIGTAAGMYTFFKSVSITEAIGQVACAGVGAGTGPGALAAFMGCRMLFLGAGMGLGVTNGAAVAHWASGDSVPEALEHIKAAAGEIRVAARHVD